MYFVYLLKFSDGSCYVGCTSNISRRCHQHNENARKKKSKLGNYLSSNNIVLSVKDFEIIFSSESRPEALSFERRSAKSFASNDIKLLNDTYSKECTRIGKKNHDSSKEYVVVDMVDHTATLVHGLKPYCENTLGIDYKLIQRTVGGSKVSFGRYKAFFLDQWNAIEDKDFFLSGKILQANTDQWMKRHIKAASKEYEVKFPDGHTEIVKNLDQFARDHNLTPGTLHGTFKKNKPTKGYQVIRRI